MIAELELRWDSRKMVQVIWQSENRVEDPQLGVRELANTIGDPTMN